MNPLALTVGILAGGRATRLGGADKAWLLRDGEPQLLHIARHFNDHPVLVSANRDPARFAAHGFVAIADRVVDAGPLSGIDALLAACAGPWLLTVPVDAIDLPDDLLVRLQTASGRGAFAIDGDGVQPLVALWPVVDARIAVSAALTRGEYAVQALQSRLGMVGVAWPGCRFGNLNTPADLAAAGVRVPSES